MQTKEEKKAKFREWYATNKAVVNAKRQKKYEEDEAYRLSTLARAAAWREQNPAASRAGASRFKVVKGKEVEAFRITEVGKMIGRSDQTIRDWEARGLIPRPTIESAHRYYTKHQVKLLQELCDIAEVVRGETREVSGEAIASKSKAIHKLWSK